MLPNPCHIVYLRQGLTAPWGSFVADISSGLDVNSDTTGHSSSSLRCYACARNDESVIFLRHTENAGGGGQEVFGQINMIYLLS